MSDQYRFVRAVVCDGRPCASDEVVAAGEIEPGTLESCLRMGYCVPAAVAEPEQSAPDQPAPKKSPRKK